MPQRQPSARRSPRLVQILSWTALGASGLFLIAFFFYAGQFFTNRAIEPAPPVPEEIREKVAVIESEITGFDREGLPFRIDSQQALQDPAVPNIIELKVISGNLQRPSGTRMAVGADQGRYDSKTKTLRLSGNVSLKHGSDYTARMPQADVSLDKKSLFTEAPVIVDFPGGQITSNGLKISDNARQILFFNRIRARYGGGDRKKDRQE